jgi:gamma-carbonic anhydrase
MKNEGLQSLLRKNLTFPTIHNSAFIAPTANIIGNIIIHARASVWYQAVLRADLNPIVIDEESNIQDGVVVHLSDDFSTLVGKRVTVGHRAILHACKIENEVLIGMGSIIMDGAEIGEGSIIGAGALVPKGMVVPPNSLVMGFPAKVVRMTRPDEREGIVQMAHKYVIVSEAHREAGIKPFSYFN